MRHLNIFRRDLSRSQKAAVSVVTSYVLELVNILSALVVPRYILTYFGSEANGLIGSITQFLGYISLLQMGVGGVIRASLFKPLAHNDRKQISRVIKTSERFFSKIGYISIAYTLVLALLFPIISESNFDFLYVASIVVIIAMGTIAQYLWGFAYRNLLIADQRGYISSVITIFATMVNILITVLMIAGGASLHATKLVSSTVFVTQPLLLRYYCKKYYEIDKHVETDDNALKQRWDGMFHSLADFVHRKTDVFILTVAATLKDISVYSVYSVITNGLNAVISMVTSPFASAMGNMLAKQEENVVKDTMRIYFLLVHYVSTIVFSVAILMILPFVQIYTEGVQDANYLQGTFAVLLITAEMVSCMKSPYGSLIAAAGHYKETKLGPALEAGINLVVSIILVDRFGLNGIALGTLLGMVAGTIYSIWYVRHHIIQLTYATSIKRYAVSTASVLLVTAAGKFVNIPAESVLGWIEKASVVTIIAVVIITGVHIIFYKKELIITIRKVKQVLGKRK